jgi:hypothetical protein
MLFGKKGAPIGNKNAAGDHKTGARQQEIKSYMKARSMYKTNAGKNTFGLLGPSKFAHSATAKDTFKKNVKGFASMGGIVGGVAGGYLGSSAGIKGAAQGAAIGIAAGAAYGTLLAGSTAAGAAMRNKILKRKGKKIIWVK